MANQTDQIIEERRKRIEENRKKVVRYNLLLILFLASTILGLVGTIYSYTKLKASEDRATSISDSLGIASKALKFSRDSLQLAKAALAKQKAFSDSILIALYKANPKSESAYVTTIVNNLSNSRDLAREFAREGYRKLKKENRDFTGAMEAFNKSEKAYNGYRDSYDVWFLLWSNRTKLDIPATQKQVLEKILSKYNSLQILTKADLP